MQKTDFDLSSFTPSKNKGQNFLIDHKTINDIYQTISDVDQYGCSY